LVADLHPCSASRGLLGLCLLIDARRPARVDAVGDLVLLDHQDRRLWSKESIAEGMRWTELALRGDAPAHRYALEAAIAAVHAEAASSATTDWRQIRALYDVLARVQPSSVVALNRAVAVGMERGPMAGLAVLDALQEHPELLRYHLFAAARAEFLSRSDRIPEALAAFRAARELTANQSERRFLDRRIRQLESA
jgi:RNA polymerase sigma-70 factor (ECF subfamily)